MFKAVLWLILLSLSEDLIRPRHICIVFPYRHRIITDITTVTTMKRLYRYKIFQRFCVVFFITGVVLSFSTMKIFAYACNPNVHPSEVIESTNKNKDPTDLSGVQCCDPGLALTGDGTCCPPDRIQVTPGVQKTVTVNGKSQIEIIGGKSTCPATKNSCAYDTSTNNGPNCLFTTYVNPVVNLLSALVGMVVVIGIIFGAIEYTSSGGDPSRAASGKKHIVNALIGLLAYILLYAFLEFIIPGGILNNG